MLFVPLQTSKKNTYQQLILFIFKLKFLLIQEMKLGVCKYINYSLRNMKELKAEFTKTVLGRTLENWHEEKSFEYLYIVSHNF